ncbi:tetratricopeptide repeat protein [Catellatospora methionotrophica]|nr:hypothetical protein [Catellatospora methionotrophica]
MTREQLAAVRDQAREMAERTCFRQAAAALAKVERLARQTFGSTDGDVLQVRHELAQSLFESGDYRSAAPVYQGLAADLADSDLADLLFECRQKAASCHALTGNPGDALRELDELLDDKRQFYGETDPRTSELRKQIGLLQFGLGERSAAQKTLFGLLDDLRLLPGSGTRADDLAKLLSNLGIDSPARGTV